MSLMITDFLQLFTCSPVKNVRPVCSENNSSSITVSVWLSISCVAATTHILIYKLRSYFFAYDIYCTNFSPVTFTNVEIRPKIFWLFLTLLSNLCQISRAYLVSVSDYCTWTKTTTQKNWVFWSYLFKIQVMITSLIEMLELKKTVHMTTCIM